MENIKKITLRDYYDGLPSSSSPKTEFVTKIAYLTGKSHMAVMNWISGRAKPKDDKDLEILSRESGIPTEDLFE